jgi:TRAP-type transport system periplasmic protein
MKTNSNSFQTTPWSGRSLLAVGLACALVSWPCLAQGASQRLRIGTIAPTGSLYDTHLKQLGQRWRNAPAGGIQMRIIAGTSESDLVKLMRLGQIDGALLTGIGLAEIEKGITALQLSPMMFRDLEELDFVSGKLQPRLEADLKEKGFVVLFWGDTGWVRFFSKEPVIRPDDLRRTKLFAWAGDPLYLQFMREAGLQAVSLETSDIMLGFATGMINAASLAPQYVLAIQADRHAPHMLELNWAPLLGAFVLTRRAWDRLPEQSRQFILATAPAAGKELTAAARKFNDEAVTAMRERGLTTHPVSPELEAEWRREVEALHPKIRGKLVPAGLFDETRGLLEERRRLTEELRRTRAGRIGK